jgi:hypothetical protein
VAVFGQCPLELLPDRSAVVERPDAHFVARVHHSELPGRTQVLASLALRQLVGNEAPSESPFAVTLTP